MPTATLRPSAYDSGTAFTSSAGTLPGSMNDGLSTTYLQYSVATDYSVTTYYTVENITSAARQIVNPRSYHWIAGLWVHGGADYTIDSYGGWRSSGGTNRLWTRHYSTCDSDPANATSGSTYNNSLVDTSTIAPPFGGTTVYNPNTVAELNAMKAVWSMGGTAGTPGPTGRNDVYDAYFQVRYSLTPGGMAYHIREYLGPVLGSSLLFKDFLRVCTHLYQPRPPPPRQVRLRLHLL